MTDNMCRICLCGDRRMYAIKNTVLQEMWEKLTNSKFNTNYGKPSLVCYMCCAQLKKCSELRERALKAEEWLTSFSNNGLNQSLESISWIASLTNDLDSMCFIKELFQFECRQYKTDTVKEVKKENEEEYEEHEQEENEINIKEEEDSCQVDNLDVFDAEPGTLTDDKEPLRSMIMKDILQREVRIILERTDIDAPATKRILNEVSQKAKRIEPNETTEDKNILANAVSKSIQINNCKAPVRSSSKNLSVYMNEENFISKPATNSTFNCSVVNKISPNIPPESVILVNNKTLSQLSHNDAKSIIFKQCLEKSADMVAPSTTKDGCDQGKTSNGFYRLAPENKFLCRICQYVCVTKRELNRHLRKHTGEKPYTCDLCDYACSEKNYLKSHLTYKHNTKEKKIACHICEYKCNRNSNLVKHLRKHTGEKPYTCDSCDFACSEKGALKRHLKYKHVKERNFACHICEYKCVEKASVKKHLRTHTGEKPYTCDLCDYACSEKNNLKSHLMYKHTKEKNFACHICEYKCVTKWDLNRHLRIHTGEKPYTCGLCNYACAEKGRLKQHLMYKHMKEKTSHVIYVNTNVIETAI